MSQALVSNSIPPSKAKWDFITPLAAGRRQGFLPRGSVQLPTNRDAGRVASVLRGQGANSPNSNPMGGTQLSLRHQIVTKRQLDAARHMQLAKIPHTHQTTPPATRAASADQHGTHRGRNRYHPSTYTTKDEAPGQLPGAQKHV